MPQKFDKVSAKQKERCMKISWKPLIPLFVVFSSSTLAADTQCLTDKYQAYVDASISWYKQLSELASAYDPALEEVSQWYVDERIHHFELNQLTVEHYLATNPSKVNTALPVESWLQLSQPDIKALTERDDALGKAATLSFEDRQRTPHKQNYELRSAFADILSDPAAIAAPLEAYNNQVNAAAEISCE
jgi:hypothetical protein